MSAEAADFAEVADFTFTIPAHATVAAAVFSLTPVDDSVVEPDETVSVGSTTRGVVVVPALVTIADDDTTAPSLSGATVEGAGLVLTFDEALDEASVPGAGAFSVLVEGAPRAVDAVAVRGARVPTSRLESGRFRSAFGRIRRVAPRIHRTGRKRSPPHLHYVGWRNEFESGTGRFTFRRSHPGLRDVGVAAPDAVADGGSSLFAGSETPGRHRRAARRARARCSRRTRPAQPHRRP